MSSYLSADLNLSVEAHMLAVFGRRRMRKMTYGHPT